MSMAQEKGEPASGNVKSRNKSTTTEIAEFKPVTAGTASAIAEQPVFIAQETGEPASGKLESEAKSATTNILQFKTLTAGPGSALAEQPVCMV